MNLKRAGTITVQAAGGAAAGAASDFLKGLAGELDVYSKETISTATQAAAAGVAKSGFLSQLGFVQTKTLLVVGGVLLVLLILK